MKQRRRTRSMRNAPKSFGERLIESMREAVAIERGELEPAAVRRYPITAREASATPAPMVGAAEVRVVRERLEVSQPVFAAALNVSAETVKAWEQGKKRPGGAAARLLQIAKQHPAMLKSTLQQTRRQVASRKVSKSGGASHKARLARAEAGRGANRRGRKR